ncbi:hypothetical protein ACET87_10645 [Aeromonas veronii]
MDLGALIELLPDVALYGVISGIGAFCGGYLSKRAEYMAQIQSTELLRTVESKVDELFNKKERYDLLLLEKMELYAQLIFDIHATFAPSHHAFVIERIEYSSVFENANKAVLIQRLYFPELEEVTNNLFNAVVEQTSVNYLCHGSDSEYNVQETRKSFSQFENEIMVACEKTIKALHNYISTNLNQPISK